MPRAQFRLGSRPHLAQTSSCERSATRAPLRLVLVAAIGFLVLCLAQVSLIGAYRRPVAQDNHTRCVIFLHHFLRCRHWARLGLVLTSWQSLSPERRSQLYRPRSPLPHIERAVPTSEVRHFLLPIVSAAPLSAPIISGLTLTFCTALVSSPPALSSASTAHPSRSTPRKRSFNLSTNLLALY